MECRSLSTLDGGCSAVSLQRMPEVKLVRPVSAVVTVVMPGSDVNFLTADPVAAAARCPRYGQHTPKG